MSIVETSSVNPRVLAICCLYCGYAAADVAGTSQIHYPEAVRIVKVPCTGSIEDIDLLRAFEAGVDGVLIFGCPDGQCHHKQGNARAKKMVARVQTLLHRVGLGADRLEFHGLSASMGAEFAATLTDGVERIRALGHNPLGRCAPSDTTREHTAEHGAEARVAAPQH